MVRTTQTERDRVATEWTTLLATLAPDAFSNPDPDAWRITQRTATDDCWVHTRFDNPRTLGLNFDYWRDWAPERQLTTYIHGLGHYYETNHTPAFWDHVATLHQRAQAAQPRLNDLFGTTLDWPRVAREAIGEVTAELVDRRVEEPAERQAKLADALDVTDAPLR